MTEDATMIRGLEDAVLQYAEEHGAIGLDYEQIYDAFVAGALWMNENIADALFET